MSEPTIFEVIPLQALLGRVQRLHEEHFRLVQIGATRLPERLELNYSFDREDQLLNLRVFLTLESPRVPSISSIFWCAFIYENEINDLFKVQVDGMVIDFKGEFYQTAVKYPFGSRRLPVAKTAPARSAAPGSALAAVPAASLSKTAELAR